jgi:hypothetical protein
MSSGFGQQRSWHGCTPHHVSRTTSHHASAKRTHAALGAPRPWPPGTAVALIPCSPADPITEACLHQVEHCHSRGTCAPSIPRYSRPHRAACARSRPRVLHFYRPLSPTRAALLPPALAHACCTSTARSRPRVLHFYRPLSPHACCTSTARSRPRVLHFYRPLSPTRAALLPPALAHACCTSTARAPLSLADAHATRLPRASPPFCGGRDPHIYAYGSQARTNAAHPYFQHFLDQLLRKPAHLRSHRG